MWDKIFGYVGLPVLVDLLNKLGVGGAAKQAISELKTYGQSFYLSNKRRVGLFSIKPLRMLHLIACIVHAAILIAATNMSWNENGQGSKFLNLIVLAVASLIHLGMFLSLPYPVKYKKDADGDVMLYPDQMEVEVEGQMQMVDHPLAGQRMLDDSDPNHKVDLDKISLTWSINLTTIAGFVSSIALLLLCKATGNQGFLFLSFFIGVLSAFSLEVFVQVFNWILVKVVRMAEGSASFLFAQAAILLPHITAESVDKHAADTLIPEQKFLPAYVKIRDLCFEAYLYFVLALMLSPTPAMFGWVASSLFLMGIISHLMIKSGQSAKVIARRQSFLNILFVLVIPMAIVQSFFRSFFPELAANVQSNVGSIIMSMFGFLGFVAHPCEHITTGKPWRFVLVAIVLGYLVSKMIAPWKKELKETDSNPFVHRSILIGGALLMFGMSVVALGTGIGALINFTGSTICYEQPNKQTVKTVVASIEISKSTEVQPAVQEEAKTESPIANSEKPVEPEVRPISEAEKAQLQENVGTLSQKVASQQQPAIAPQGKPDPTPPSEPVSAAEDEPSPEFVALTKQLGIKGSK